MSTQPSELVRETARYITSLSDSEVRVNATACHKAAHFLHGLLVHEMYTYESISASWRNANGLHPSEPSLETLKWIFTVDTLNFCFWTEQGEEPFTVLYKKEEYLGYWALCASINRALDEGIPITDPGFMKTVECKTLSHVFRSSTSTPIPLLDKRVEVLNEAGRVLTNKFDSSVKALVESANGSAQALVQQVILNFSSYDDSLPLSVLHQKKSNEPPPPYLPKLCFYKRAQILVADIWACFATEQKYQFHDISTLTMFPDYRVPQILLWLKAIEYSDDLMNHLKLEKELARGSRREIEIRACSIVAVEQIRSQLEVIAASKHDSPPNSTGINSVLVDFLLWDYATGHGRDLSGVPIHRVRSIYY